MVAIKQEEGAVMAASMMFRQTSILLAVVYGVASVVGVPTQRFAQDCENIPYNSTYPLSPPLKKNNEVRYRFAMVADRDKLSKMKGETFKWQSRLRKGWLVLEDLENEIKVKKIEIDKDELTLIGDMNQKGKGMELSELKVYNGKLYTCDDKTGIVYELKDGNPTPEFFARLNDGNGHKTKGFKCEWMTVRNQLLYVGSAAIEWVQPNGTIIHNDTFWYKTVDPRGLVTSYDGYELFDAMRKSVGYDFPGYFFNEAINWSDERQAWFILPRKGSKEKYDEKLDESRCTNKLFITKSFTKFENVDVGVFNQTRGFSSFKFIPGSKDEAFIALKTVEVDNSVETYIGVYSTKGETLFDLQFVCDDKFEGVEFI